MIVVYAYKTSISILRYKMCKAPWLHTEFLSQKVENKQAQTIHIDVHIHTHIYIYMCMYIYIYKQWGF